MTSSVDLKKVSRIDQRRKDIVFGFIKNIQSTFPHNKAYYNADGLIKYLCLLYYVICIDSSIITDEQSDEFLKLIKEKEAIKNIYDREWNLLYRLSDDGFDLEMVRKKCHGKEEILAFIETEKKNIFGGYLSVGWPFLNGSYQQTIDDDDSFLFLIQSFKNDKMDIFPVRDPNYPYSSVSSQSYVCIFGGGYDICIGKDCQTNMSSYTRGNNYVNLPAGYLNGDTHDESKFNVKNIEVYQLLQSNKIL